MNKIIVFINVLLISSATSAFDTEIYGTAGNTTNNKANPNVLFILDTSGSMQGSVSHTVTTSYNPETNYSGNMDDIYPNPNYNSGWGWKESLFTQDESTGCDTVLQSLNDTGKAETTLLQLNGDEWLAPSTNSSKAIRCDKGFSFTLYSANYSNWFQSNQVTITSTRMELLKSVITNLTENLEDINLGLMRFNRNGGGTLSVPVADIATSGPLIRQTLTTYSPGGGTPLTEAMHDAADYYRGGSSPITTECQKNHVILFTDGEPSGDTDSNGYIHDRLAEMGDITGVIPAIDDDCSGDGGCLDELAYWMKNTDHSGHIGVQPITTYTIGGFNLSTAADSLGRTATLGGGKFYEADNAVGISSVLTAIFTEILATDATFTAPAVSVNAFNASEHKDELFYALFRPDDKAKWAGNLKKYKLSPDGVVMDNSKNTEGADNPIPAIDEDTGYFKVEANGFWNTTTAADGTPLPDGKNVSKGGIANKLEHADRNLFSNDSDNNLISFDTAATAENFGMEDNTTDEFEKVRDWTKGIDVLDIDGDLSVIDTRKSIGDPLHSEPVIVTYGGTKENPDSTIFFGTNEGFIHAIAIDSEAADDGIKSGDEEFAFIPKELLPIQETYFENPAFNEKPYGMDGLISTWFYDIGGNGIIYNSDGNLESGLVDGVSTPEHAYLYSGMRRGGNSYYGLDVTDRSAPTMLFKITGGTEGFEKLGETWSRMTVAKVKFNKKSKFVLFFTGGYSTNQDGHATRKDDTIGNAIYMVDATTGDLLWTAGKTGEDLNITEMKNSMPASVSAIDITGDGHINYLFAADTAGRVFRIDIDQENTNASTFAHGGMIAQVGGNTEATNLRFYNKPNVALVKDKAYGDYLTISIGSGHRAHPILTTAVNNRFYVIKDHHPYPYRSNETPIYHSKTEASTNTLSSSGVNSQMLYDATDLMTDGKDAYINDMPAIMNSGGGWFVDMNANGEKVLAESTTFSSAIIFTSFSPTSGTLVSNCGADSGTARMYVLDQKTAMPAIDLNEDGILNSDDSFQTLTHSGIAPRPVVIYREGGGKTIAIGTETINDDRFEESAPDETCEDTNSCDDEIKKCEANSCNVTPVYWHLNDN